MAQRIKKIEEALSLRGELDSVVSYADYFARRPLFSTLQVKNDGEEAFSDILLTIEGTNGVTVPFQRALEIPFESVVEIALGEILSPLYFAEAEEVKEEKITVTLKKEDKTLVIKEWTVTTLPFDFWQGTQGAAELLASFVRPRLGDCAKVQTDIVAQLKKWGASCELGSYVGNDKNAVRNAAAALFSALRKYSILQKRNDCGYGIQ